MPWPPPTCAPAQGCHMHDIAHATIDCLSAFVAWRTPADGQCSGQEGQPMCTAPYGAAPCEAMHAGSMGDYPPLDAHPLALDTAGLVWKSVALSGERAPPD